MEQFLNKITNIDALTGLKSLADKSVNCLVCSPPYWGLRAYLKDNDPNKKYELGQEPYFKDYINNLCDIFKEVYRVLRDDGCCFVNIDDTHYGSTRGNGGLNSKQWSNPGSLYEGKKFCNKEMLNRSLCNIPYRFAIKMTDDLKWIQRNIIIWHAPNKFPESVKNRFTIDFEPIFFFTKSEKYDFRQQLEPYSTKYNYDEKYDGNATKDYDSVNAQNPSDSKRRILESIKNGKGRNKRAVFSVNVQPTRYKHTATYPEKLIEPLILAGSPENGIVLDIFGGIGTTSLVAKRNKRNFIHFELSSDYCKIAEERLSKI